MKVLITGPESSGKTTLARALAWSLDGYYIEEQARKYLNDRSGLYTANDLSIIWERQRSAENRADEQSRSLLVCDTGPEVIAVWSRVKYGFVADMVTRAVTDRHYDLKLLCAPDLAWQPDPLREAPDDAARWKLFEAYQQLLPHAIIISGNNRIEQAVSVVTETMRDAE